MKKYCDASEQVKLLGLQHIGSCAGLTSSEIVTRLENVAYRLVREGEATQAMTIFVAVAGVEIANLV